ncbi:AAA family ATPase [Clostridium saccharoperbutylacetonicum]
MQGIKLVYFYLFSSRTGLNNIGLTFSNRFKFEIQEFDIDYLECKVLIKKNEKTDEITEEFWGEEKHVSRVDLLVGENGAGKSTIMKYLGNESDDSAIWIAIYLGIEDEKFTWFSNTNIDIPMDIEIIEDWSMNNDIKPEEIENSSFVYKYINNELESNLNNNALSVYKFVRHKLKILQEHFPAKNLTYSLNIPVDLNFMGKFTKNRNLNSYVKNILKISTTFIVNENKEFQVNIMDKDQYGYGNTDEDYIKYRQHIDALLAGYFYRDEFLEEKLNLLRMAIYVCWILNIDTNISNIKYLELPCNFNSLFEFNMYLKKVLNDITNKSKNRNSIIKIIKEYMEFDFVEKLFCLVAQMDVSLRIKSTLDIEFNIFLNEEIEEEVELDITNLINFTEKINKGYRDNNIKRLNLWSGFCNMSSGEMGFINLFSRIYQFFLEDKTVDYDEDFEIEKNNKASSFLFLLDEPDASFHPEWSRCFIHYVTKFINNLLIGTDKKCQLIITTHSPFMVSDMPQNYVMCIELKSDKNGNYSRTLKNPKHSFAANIYELLNDGFFMDAPIGEFAQQKIQKIIDRINGLDNFPTENLISEIEFINSGINMVSDKLVRGRLNDMLEKKKKIQLDYKSTNALEYLLIEIQELKREIFELKSKNNGEKNDFNR